MAVWKVLARCPKTKRQEIKKIYENDIKYHLYGVQTAKRYQANHNVEVYQMSEDGDYVLKYTLSYPMTKEELEVYASEMDYGDNWVLYRLRNLNN